MLNEIIMWFSCVDATNRVIKRRKEKSKKKKLVVEVRAWDYWEQEYEKVNMKYDLQEKNFRSDSDEYSNAKKPSLMIVISPGR